MIILKVFCLIGLGGEGVVVVRVFLFGFFVWVFLFWFILDDLVLYVFFFVCFYWVLDRFVCGKVLVGWFFAGFFFFHYFVCSGLALFLAIVFVSESGLIRTFFPRVLFSLCSRDVNK